MTEEYMEAAVEKPESKVLIQETSAAEELLCAKDCKAVSCTIVN